MSIRYAPRLALLSLAIALAACKPAAEKAADESPSPVPESATTTAPAEPAPDPALAGTDATAVVHHTQPDPTGFDRKSFAGAFSADATRLEIASGGTFTLVDGDETVNGTWTIDDAGKRLLLDPDTKAGTDRHFEIVSNDELRAVDADGKPLDGAALRRG